MSLAEDPFAWTATKSGELRITRGGRIVMVLGGPRAAKLLDVLGEDDEHDQQLLARATGNYRRGNERR